jgi:hypothetical protein
VVIAPLAFKLMRRRGGGGDGGGDGRGRR